MRVSQHFGGYNARRYSRPWIGKISAWPVGGKPTIAWGAYLGTDNGGEVEIEAQAGDIVRTGQKDGRGNNTTADWCVVEADGTLRKVTSAQARAAYEVAQ